MISKFLLGEQQKLCYEVCKFATIELKRFLISKRRRRGRKLATNNERGASLRSKFRKPVPRRLSTALLPFQSSWGIDFYSFFLSPSFAWVRRKHPSSHKRSNPLTLSLSISKITQLTNEWSENARNVLESRVFAPLAFDRPSLLDEISERFFVSRGRSLRPLIRIGR